jgi:hypothetical protein
MDDRLEDMVPVPPWCAAGARRGAAACARAAAGESLPACTADELGHALATPARTSDAPARASAPLLGAAPVPGSHGAPPGGPPPLRGALEVELCGDEDDGDVLLDWERHSTWRWRAFGTWAMRFVPERFHRPPEW